MPLDGLRAWIGEVERKLGMRTRVFLVLATIAIGGAGAAIYLATDTRDDAVSESDVRELQEQLEAQIAAGEASAPLPPEESTEPPTAPQPETEPETAPKPKSGSKQGPGDDATGAAGASAGADDATGGAGVPRDRASKAKLQELLERTKRENAEAEK